MPFTESLTDFHDTDDFATAATFTPAGGVAAESVVGLFDKAYVDPFGAVDGVQIVYRAWLAQFAARPAQGATLVIGGVTYRVRKVEDLPPNATEVRLYLQETA